MKLSRALSDLVKYTRSVGLYDIEAEGEQLSEQMFTLLTQINELMGSIVMIFTHSAVSNFI